MTAESPRGFSPKKTLGARVQIRDGRFFENFTEGDEGQIIGLDGDVAIVRFDKQGEHRVSRRHLKVGHGSSFRSVSPSDDLRKEVLFWNQTVDAASFLMDHPSPRSGGQSHGPVEQVHQNIQSPAAIRHLQRSSVGIMDKKTRSNGDSFTPPSLSKSRGESNGKGISQWNRGHSQDKVSVQAFAPDKMEERYGSKALCQMKPHEEVRAKATHGTTTGGGARQQQPQQLQHSRHDRYPATSDPQAQESRHGVARDPGRSPLGDRMKVSTRASRQKQQSASHEWASESAAARHSPQNNRLMNRVSEPVPELPQRCGVRRSKELEQEHHQYSTQRTFVSSPRAGGRSPLSFDPHRSVTEKISKRAASPRGTGAHQERSPSGMSSHPQHYSTVATPPRYSYSPREQNGRLTAFKSTCAGRSSQQELSLLANVDSTPDPGSKARRGGGYSPRIDRSIRKGSSPREVDRGPAQSSYASQIGKHNNMSPRLEELLNKYNITLLNEDASPRSKCLTHPSQGQRRSVSPRRDTNGSLCQNDANASCHRSLSPPQRLPSFSAFESATPLDDDRRRSRGKESRTFATASPQKSFSGTTDRQPSQRDENRTFTTASQQKSFTGTTDRQPSRREEERMRASDRYLPPRDKKGSQSGRSPRTQEANMSRSPLSDDGVSPTRDERPTYFTEVQRRSACPTIVNHSATPSGGGQGTNRNLRMTDLFSPYRATTRDTSPRERFVTIQGEGTAQANMPLEMPRAHHGSNSNDGGKSGYVSTAAMSDRDGCAQMQPGSIMRPGADRTRISASERNDYPPTKHKATMRTSAHEVHDSRTVVPERDGVSTAQWRRDEMPNEEATWASTHEEYKSKTSSGRTGLSGVSRSQHKDEEYLSMQNRGEFQDTLRTTEGLRHNEDQASKIASLEADVRTMSCLLAQSEARVEKLASAVYTQQAKVETFHAETTANLPVSIVDSRACSRAEENAASRVHLGASLLMNDEPQMLHEDARASKLYSRTSLPPTAGPNENLRRTLPIAKRGDVSAASMDGMKDTARHSAPTNFAVVRSSVIKPHWPTASSSRSPSPTQKADFPASSSGPGYNGSPRMKLLVGGGKSASPVVAVLPYHTDTVAAQQNEIAASDPNLFGRQHYGAHFRVHTDAVDASLPASVNLPLPDLRTPSSPPQVGSCIEVSRESTMPDPLLTRSATFDRHILAKSAAQRDVTLNSSRKGSLATLRENASTADPLLGPPRLSAASDLVVADSVEPVVVPSTMPSPPPRHRGAIPCEALSPTRRLCRANSARQAEQQDAPPTLPVSFTLDGPSAFAMTYPIGTQSSVSEDTNPVSERILEAEDPIPPWQKYSAFGPTAKQMHNRGTVNPLLAPTLAQNDVAASQALPMTFKPSPNLLDDVEIRNDTQTGEALKLKPPARFEANWCDAPPVQRDSVKHQEVIPCKSSPKVGALCQSGAGTSRQSTPRDETSSHPMPEARASSHPTPRAETPSHPTSEARTSSHPTLIPETPLPAPQTTQNTARLETLEDTSTVPDAADGATVTPKASPYAGDVPEASPGLAAAPKAVSGASTVPKNTPSAAVSTSMLVKGVAPKVTTGVIGGISNQVGLHMRGLDTHSVKKLIQPTLSNKLSFGMANTTAPHVLQRSVTVESLPCGATTTPQSGKNEPTPVQGRPLSNRLSSTTPLARSSSHSSASSAHGFGWICCADTQPKNPLTRSTPSTVDRKYLPNPVTSSSSRSAFGTPTPLATRNFVTRQVSAPQGSLPNYASAKSLMSLSTGSPQTLGLLTAIGVGSVTTSRSGTGSMETPSSVPQIVTKTEAVPTSVRAPQSACGMTSYSAPLCSPNPGKRLQSPVRTVSHTMPAVRGTGALDGQFVFKPDFRLMEAVSPTASMAQVPYETRATSPNRYFNSKASLDKAEL